MNEILESLGMSMLSQKFEDERVDFNVIMSASDEDLVRLGVLVIEWDKEMPVGEFTQDFDIIKRFTQNFIK